MNNTTIPLADICFDSNIYPRENYSTKLVEEYVDVIKAGKPFDAPIILETGTNRLLDGKHRTLAYQKYIEQYQEAQTKKEFEVEEWAQPVYDVPVRFHTIPEGIPPYLYALSLSAKHGARISAADKKTNSRRAFTDNPDFNLATLAEYAGISTKTAKEYVKDLLAKRQEEQKYIAYRLYLAGWTQAEIGASIGCPQNTVTQRYFLSKKGNAEEIPFLDKNSPSGLPAASEFGRLETQVKDAVESGIPHLDVAERFNLPLILVHAIDMLGRTDEERMARLNMSVQPYDVWNFGKCDDLYGNHHPGRIPGQLIAHVLYFFTNPGDVVIDPMCGSGTTQDVCLVMGRKCYGYDIDARHGRPDVIPHNIQQQGWPDRLKKAALIFWDAPYFQKMDQSNIGEEGYIDGSISSLDRDAYLSFFRQAFADAYTRVRPGTKLAFLMSDWDDHTGTRPGIFLWDYARAIQDAKWVLTRHLQIPLSTQQVHPDIVNKFRKSRRLARLERYLLIAEKPGTVTPAEENNDESDGLDVSEQ